MVSRRALIGFGALGASAAVTAGALLLRGNPAARGMLGDVTHLKGYAGGEKIAFIENPKTVAALKHFGLALDADRAGSVDMVRDPQLLGTHPQFLWPSSSPLVELARRNAKVLRDQVIFNSPIVIYSWTPFAEGLVRAGLATKEHEHYYIDARKLVDAVLQRKAWKELGQPDLYGTVRLIATDPNKSNSGFMFAGLAANLLSGDVATEENLPQIMPQLTELFHGMGYKPDSSGKVFDDYIAGGPGAQPLVVGYENQLVEWIIADTDRWSRVESVGGPAKPVALYPKPTVYSAHPLLALAPDALRLIDALMSPDLQTIGWREHGFRGPLGSVGADTHPLIKGRMPDQIAAVAPMPDIEVMLKILAALA
jgi:Bacterial extracellular solute-binding protein